MYKNRFNQLLESTIGNVKPLLEYDESNKFYNPNKEIMDGLEKKIETKINDINIDLKGWIYNNIIRTANPKNNVEFNEWLGKNENNFKKMCHTYIERYNKNNDIIKAFTDTGGNWFQINFNRKLKNKQTINGKEVTYNYYLTFENSIENFKSWLNNFSELINKFYQESLNGSLQNSATSMKMGYDIYHYIWDYDHMKFYWYNKEDESKVEGIINDWLSKYKISTANRPYTKGIDVSHNNNSFGILVATTLNDELSKLIKKYGNRFSPKQYSDYILKMLNTAKFNF